MLCAKYAAPRIRSRLTDRVAAQLSEQIQQGVFELGVQLPSEARMADLYQVSRSVIREVLSNLQAHGLVATRQGAGTFVVHNGECDGRRASAMTYSLENRMELLEVQTALEVEAAGLAALRRSDLQLRAVRAALDALHCNERTGNLTESDDSEFRLQIALCTNNPYLISAISDFCTVLTGVSTCVSGLPSTMGGHLPGSISSEREQIYAAIWRQDLLSAQAAMLVHLRNGSERIKARYWIA